MKHPEPNPYPFHSAAEVWVNGRWSQGGVALIAEGDRPVPVQLPPALFAVWVLLIQAGKRAETEGNWAAGFLSVSDLCRLLQQHTRGTASPLLPDPAHAIRYVFRLRQALAKALRRRGDWAKRMIEYQPFLGYRLSTPPDKLHLNLLPEWPTLSAAENRARGFPPPDTG